MKTCNSWVWDYYSFERVFLSRYKIVTVQKIGHEERNENMSNSYFVIPKKIFSKEFTDLTSNSRILYAYLCYLENEYGKDFRVSVDQMAENLSVGRNTILRSRKQLSNIGLISYQVKHDRFEIYTSYTIKYL